MAPYHPRPVPSVSLSFTEPHPSVQEAARPFRVEVFAYLDDYQGQGDLRCGVIQSRHFEFDEFKGCVYIVSWDCVDLRDTLLRTRRFSSLEAAKEHIQTFFALWALRYADTWRHVSLHH